MPAAQYSFFLWNQSYTFADHEDVKSIIDPDKRREKQQEVEDEVSNKGYQCGYYGGMLPDYRFSNFENRISDRNL